MKSNQTRAVESAPFRESDGLATGFARRLLESSTQRPVLAIILVSLLAVVINCYPIIFCGRSYVSPACAGPLVYGWWPPVPEMPATTLPVRDHGSDTWAMMLWGVPTGFIESRSLLQYGELPLWNRYSHAGDTLIGQAISMFGDPLQLIVILGRGAAAAWDVKFVVAKFLFCVGFGLLILRLLASRPLALIYAALAAYCGAFFFINNHTVFFVFCYAPWILLSALAWLDLRSERHVRWGLAWLLANFACFNAGHVEVAVDLIGGLNLAALACVLVGCRHVAEVARVLGRMVIGALLFCGLTAPMWMSFLVALKGAYTAHSEVQVAQLPFATLLGAFDDLFYHFRSKNGFNAAIAPGASLLVLAGCIFSALRWRDVKGQPFFWINTGAILLWGGFIFGWIPAPVLAAIPFLNRVSHTQTDFSYLLVIHLTVQSAYGFKCLAAEKDFRRAAVDFLWLGLVLAALVLLFCYGAAQGTISWGYVLCAGAGAIGAPLLFAFFKCRTRAIPALGWAGIILLGFLSQFRFGLYSFGDENLLLIPGPRLALDAPSNAIDKIKADRSGPFRVVGLGVSLLGDYAAVYGLEDIRSCAPVSNGELIQLVRKFPGMSFSKDWVMQVVNPAAAQPLLNLLNVKYLLAPPDVGNLAGLDFRLADDSDFGLLENPEAWPRAFFSDEVIPVATSEEFAKQLLASGKQPFIAMTPEEIAKQPGLQNLESTDHATISPATNYQLLPNSTAFDVHAATAGMVCLTEGQARDFKVKANNKPQKVLTVNRAFKGVYLDKPGDYHIEFVYRPRYWLLAGILFWTSAGCVIAFAVMSVCRAKVRRKNLGNNLNQAI